MLYTILQIFAFQALFLLVYDLFLKRETFFNYNRAYLLITSLLSLILPFIKFPELKRIATKDFVIQLPEVFIGAKTPTKYEVQLAEQAGIVLEQPQVPIWQSVVLVGIAIATLVFIYKITKLYWLKHQNPKRWQGNVLIVKLIKSSVAFSFFNTIFLGERIPKTERPTIYKHELVHIKELHTLDLLFFELLRIVFWFNPLVYIYQSRIKELHEYIADAKAVKHNGKADYYQSLLNQVFDVSNVSFTNTFFKKSLIKKRIAMLQKSKSKQFNLVKYALLIPLVFGMLVYTSTEVRAQQQVEKQDSASQELTEAELIEKYYNEMRAMKKNGATFIEISKYAGFGEKYIERFIVSKGEYLKSKAFMKFVADGMIERKSSNGTLSDQDFETAKNMQLNWNQTYEEYRDWKQTASAKDLWEANIRDGERKLFVEDMLNKTDDEQQRYDALLNQLETDDKVEKVIITDGKSTLILDDYKSNPNRQTEVMEVVEVPFSVIEEVPTLKDCENLATNAERKRCMSQFVAKHVNKNFNIGLADSLGINGRQRIFVSFKIDKEGYVTSAKARASHPALETEAVRVIKTLPQFIPGKQKGKTVIVPYSLPIVFQIAGGEADSKSPKNERLVNTLGGETYKVLKELTAQRDRILQNSSDENPVVINLNNQIDSLRKEMLTLFEVYMEERSKMTELTTIVLINRNNQFLINDEPGNIESLEKRLQTLPPNKKHTIQVRYDKETSMDVIEKVEKLVEDYPNVSIKKEVSGALPIHIVEVTEITETQKDKLFEVPFSVVEVAPTHPDCKLIEGNEERKKCTSATVSKFVNHNFNTKLASKLGLPDGRQKIFGAFTIDKQGFVKKVKARASHPKLEEETERVLNLLPQFVPGEHKGEKIDVPFSLPIVFQLGNDKKKKN